MTALAEEDGERVAAVEGSPERAAAHVGVACVELVAFAGADGADRGGRTSRRASRPRRVRVRVRAKETPWLGRGLDKEG